MLKGNLTGNLYTLKCTMQEAMLNISENDSELWHRRMGHSSKYPANSICEVCLKGKQTQAPYKIIEEDRKAKKLLEVVSTDVCGPITPVSNHAKRYFVTFLDHFSHFAACYLLSHKSEVFEKFKIYVAMVVFVGLFS